MDPVYGVGLKQYLFSNFSETLFLQAQDKILEQVSIYMPQVDIVDIQFPNKSPDNNYLSIRIVYAIPAINTTELLEFTI